MNFKNAIQVNSDTVIAQVHQEGFNNEMTEVEKIAEEIGVYGRVLSYRTEKQGNVFNIIFKVSEENIEEIPTTGKGKQIGEALGFLFGVWATPMIPFIDDMFYAWILGKAGNWLERLFTKPKSKEDAKENFDDLKARYERETGRSADKDSSDKDSLDEDYSVDTKDDPDRDFDSIMERT